MLVSGSGGGVAVGGAGLTSDQASQVISLLTTISGQLDTLNGQFSTLLTWLNPALTAFLCAAAAVAFYVAYRVARSVWGR